MAIEAKPYVSQTPGNPVKDGPAVRAPHEPKEENHLRLANLTMPPEKGGNHPELAIPVIAALRATFRELDHKRYRLGDETPRTIDCSALVSRFLEKLGLGSHRYTTHEMVTSGIAGYREISSGRRPATLARNYKPQPGDIIVWGFRDGTSGHTAVVGPDGAHTLESTKVGTRNRQDGVRNDLSLSNFFDRAHGQRVAHIRSGFVMKIFRRDDPAES